jgi:UDP-glucuronate 4-epimerase
MASPQPLLITGTAGFIGFHLAKLALARGHEVFGFDIVNDYYDPTLKEARLALLEKTPGFKFYRSDLTDAKAVDKAFADSGAKTVIHLAALRLGPHRLRCHGLHQILPAP